MSKIEELRNWLLAGVVLLLVGAAYSLNLRTQISVDFAPNEILTFCAGEDGQSEEYLSSKELCYAKQFQQAAQAKGAEGAFNLLSELQKLDQDATGCHLIAHGIGWGVYAHNPNDWQNQIRTISSACSSGAIHGIIEKLVEDQPGKKLTDELVLSICGENPRNDCNHIIGHLLVVETQGSVDEALRRCEIFDELQQEDFCYTGVFMEYQTALNLIQHGLAPKEWLNWADRVEELEKMCRSYDGLQAEACWEEIVHAALVKFGNDAKATFDFCSSAPFAAAAQRCRKHSIGIIAAAYNFNLASIKDLCRLPQKDDPDFEAGCYEQLAASSLSSIPQDWRRVEAFCLSLPEKFQNQCLSQLTYAKETSYAKD